jgi:hypothetical protein
MDSRDKVYGIAGMATQYDDQRALKIDYTLSTEEIYIETVRCLIERKKKSGTGPLNILCCSVPDASNRSLPSWVPDWSMTGGPFSTSNTEWGTQCHRYRANGVYHLNPKLEIGKEVLKVRGLEIATVDQLGVMPVPYSEPADFRTMDLKYIAEFDSAILALQAAAKLTMPHSKYIPNSHKASDVRRKEFARTILCNIAWSEVESAMRPPSEDTIQEFSRRSWASKTRKRNGTMSG